MDPDLFKVSEGPAHPVVEIRGRPGLENYFSHFSAQSYPFWPSLGRLPRWNSKDWGRCGDAIIPYMEI